MNEKSKISVTYSDYRDFVSNLRTKYDGEFKQLSEQLEERYTVELQKWFDGHVITNSKS